MEIDIIEIIRKYEVVDPIDLVLQYKDTPDEIPKLSVDEYLKLEDPLQQNLYKLIKVEKVVVLYKDRLLKFGFELVEYVASLYNCDIEIIDNTEKSEQQELVEDLVQIITVFNCKLQGKRANKARELVNELIEVDSEK